MKRILILFLLGVSFAYGQRNFNIDETVFGPRQYAPQNLVAPQWIPNNEGFSYVDPTYQRLLEREAKSNWTEKELVQTNTLQEAVKKALPSTEEIKLPYFPYDYQWKDQNTLSLGISTKEWKYFVDYNISNGEAFVKNRVSATATNIEPTTDFSQIAYLEGNNISLIDKSGNITKVTTDTIGGIVNGSDYTHRQEFGINKGMWWSPDNSKLLYYRKDETMVTPYPLIQWNERVASVKNIRYPMAGMKSEEVTLVVYDNKTGNKTTLQTGEPKEQYLTICTWDPSGEFIYVGILNRGQNHLRLNKYNASTGAFVQTLFEEQSSTWVEPLHALIFLPNKTDQFLYQTDKDGYNQLYLYQTDGKLIKNLGHQDVIVNDVLGFNSKGDRLTYIGITNNGLDRQLFEVEIPSGKTKMLTQEPGMHSASVSTSGKFILDQYSNLTTPNTINVLSTNGKLAQNILTAENPFIGKINLPTIEPVTLRSADGTTILNGRIIYPVGFDPAKKYPVMVYLYGGSHAQLVQNRWLYGTGYFDLYMAQQGYVVFTMDNRGSDARGRDFTRVTHGQLGQAEMADQLKGIEFLKSKPFVDQERMGIFGWSFGGFMTTSFMVHHPEIFHTAVAGGPVMDWKYYEIMYGERYMDTPQENTEGYKLTSLVNKADRLKGNLLIIHGAQDPVVVQQHSMDFVEACIKAGKQVDYFLYPSHEHNVMGKDRIHMYEKIARYFDLHLKK